MKFILIILLSIFLYNISAFRIIPNRIVKSTRNTIISNSAITTTTAIKMFNNNNNESEVEKKETPIETTKETEEPNAIKETFKKLYFGLSNVSTFVIIVYTVIIISSSLSS